MAIILASESYKALNANHQLLKRGKRAPFAVHKMNRFIQTTSPKVKLQNISKEQHQLIKQKIAQYTLQADRNIFKSAVITLVITSGLLLLSSEILRYFFQA